MSHELFLPWRVTQNRIGKIAVVDNRNNGESTASGRVFNLAQGKNGRGLWLANEICRTMNATLKA